ncbi:hypothetical protein [Aldersonia kunmingensis]|uniref:hypothetical protein n=1 Tax=Aldersonia kunmingensis TaxID=408066 RepID=UPI00082A3E76|nr:hypothetical protein [Aldersonia kunmingensis]
MSTSPAPLETPRRPTVVNAAYWVWLAAAAMCVFFGLLQLFISGDAVRDALLERHPDADIDATITLIRGVGAITAVVGVAVAALAGPVRKGSARMRRTLVVLSVVFAFLLVVGSASLPIHPLLIIAGMALLIASFLVYLPAAGKWFDGA